MNNDKEQAEMPHSGSIHLPKKLYRPTICGGLAFWVLSVATSLLPIAAEYRAAFSNWSIQMIWVASLVVGTIIAWCVSNFLLRSVGKTPAADPLMESVTLSLIALAIATVFIDLPRSISGADGSLHYFLIGLGFNAVRFLGLGIAVGFLYRRQRISANPPSHSTY